MKKLVIVALVMVGLVAGCSHDPRIDDLVRHQKYQDKAIECLAKFGPNDNKDICLSWKDCEEIERLSDELYRRMHPVRYWMGFRP